MNKFKPIYERILMGSMEVTRIDVRLGGILNSPEPYEMEHLFRIGAKKHVGLGVRRIVWERVKQTINATVRVVSWDMKDLSSRRMEP